MRNEALVLYLNYELFILNSKANVVMHKGLVKGSMSVLNKIFTLFDHILQGCNEPIT